MAEFRLFVLLAILLLPECLVAQHGTANNGYYPSGYQGDTWTGIVSSLDTATKAVSLVHTHKGKSARFEGVLAKGYRVQAKDEKEKQQIRDTGIAVGAHLRVHYIPNQTSDDLGAGPSYFKAFGNSLLERPPDTKRRFNLIFLVEVLPEESESCTGTVISANDSTREITLAVTDGTKKENFIGVVVSGYQLRMKDGSFRDLVVSQIPTNTKITVHYFDEMTGPERTTGGEIHRIYRIQFLAFPQTP